MSDRNNITKIKTNSERTIQELITKQGEFRYKQTNGLVRPDLIYSTYFTEDKREVYITGIISSTNSKIIRKTGKKSIINTYYGINKNRKQSYPTAFRFIPTEDDYNLGYVNRYFTKIANDNNKPFFEISSEDFNNQNNLFIYLSVFWTIRGEKNEVIDINKTVINTLPNQLQKILFPLQLWRPSKNSSDALEKKLERLRR